MTVQLYQYDSDQRNRQILDLYQSVFNIDYTEEFSWWYLGNPFGVSTGVLAVDKDEVVAHWAVSPLPFLIFEKQRIELISLAAMVRQDYQGQGMFTRIAQVLLEHLEDVGRHDFVIGFPNEKSLWVHTNRMNYRPLLDFSFFTFPKKTNRQLKSFHGVDSIPTDRTITNAKVSVHYTDDYLSWRFSGKKYQKFVDQHGNWYVAMRFRDKMDILTWSSPSFQDVEMFAQFLYNQQSVSSVTCWRSTEEERFDKDARKYHLCIRPLSSYAADNHMFFHWPSWRFNAGDAELF